MLCIGSMQAGGPHNAAPGYFSPGYPDTALAEVARPGCTSARYRRLVRLPLRMELRQPGGTPSQWTPFVLWQVHTPLDALLPSNSAAGWSAGPDDQPLHCAYTLEPKPTKDAIGST
jgi:hypothetical protein